MTNAIVYSGAAFSAIDDKGRVAIPAEFRSLVEDSSGGRSLLITRHPTDDCLIGLGESRKQEMLDEIDREEEVALRRGEPFDRNRAARNKFSVLQKVSFDASGRFVMPPMLRAIAGLTDHVFMFGEGFHFCIWSPEKLLHAGDEYRDAKLAAQYFLDAAKEKRS